VTAIHRPKNDQSDFLIKTTKGDIKVRYIVHATNAWAKSLLPKIPIIPVRNQVIATKPLSTSTETTNWERGTFSLSTNEDCDYMCGRGDGRIVLGGLRYLGVNREIDNDDDKLFDPRVSQALRSYLELHFKKLVGRIEIDSEWIGIMGWTPDIQPLVGELPKGWFDGNSCVIGREYICAGFCGHGMTRCFLSGRTIAEMIAGVSVSEVFPKLFLPTVERLKLDTGILKSKI